MTLALLAAQEAPALPMPWSRIKRVLDAMEARFVRGALTLQETRVRALRPLVERVLESGAVPAVIPLQGDFGDYVVDFAGEVLVEGIVHAQADVLAEERRARSAGVNLKVDGEAVVPKEAIAFLESRRDLARFFDPDQVEKVRTILGNSLREGATVKQTMDALQTALPAATRARLENIARTEATAAYNQGRIYRFLQSKGFIQAVQFMAILDSRVTDICQHRNGLLFALDDPRLRENVPPLHYQCRSVLSPVSGYKLEKLGGKAALERDRAAMDEAPGPQVTKKGRFGNEPWPDAPGRSAPVPRPKPVGPQAGGGQEPPVVRETPSDSRIPGIDLLPGGPRDANKRRTPTSAPTDPPPKLSFPVRRYGVTREEDWVRVIEEDMARLPEHAQKAIADAGFVLRLKAKDLHKIPELKDLGPIRLNLLNLLEKDDGFAGAALYLEYGNQMNSLLFPRHEPGGRETVSEALHEAGHALAKAFGLEDESEMRIAYAVEHSKLHKKFERYSEFAAESLARYYMSGATKEQLERDMPQTYAILKAFDDRIAERFRPQQ